MFDFEIFVVVGVVVIVFFGWEKGEFKGFG